VNIRELWDTVVLRDILGYIVPGAVTLFAFALLGSALRWTAPQQLLTQAIDLELLSKEPWLSWHPLLAVAVLLCLSFVVGHLQILATEFMESILPEWDHASTAHSFLTGKERWGGEQSDEGPRMGDQYREAALTVFHGKSRIDFEARLQSPLSFGERAERKYHTGDQVRSAYRLWRLCDYYLQKNAPDMHTIYIGRYYVLALLFTNLGVSLILLGLFSFLRILSPYRPQDQGDLASALLVLSFFATSFVLFALRHTSPDNPKVRTTFVAFWLASGAGLLAVSTWFPSCQTHATEALLVLVGLALAHRSGFFREQFVTRVFPIFYALTRPPSTQREA